MVFGVGHLMDESCSSTFWESTTSLESRCNWAGPGARRIVDTGGFSGRFATPRGPLSQDVNQHHFPGSIGPGSCASEANENGSRTMAFNPRWRRPS